MSNYACLVLWIQVQNNIKMLRQLKKAGHYIIIHTARRMKTHNGNVQAVIEEIGDITKKTLSDFEYLFFAFSWSWSDMRMGC